MNNLLQHVTCGAQPDGHAHYEGRPRDTSYTKQPVSRSRGVKCKDQAVRRAARPDAVWCHHARLGLGRLDVDAQFCIVTVTHRVVSHKGRWTPPRRDERSIGDLAVKETRKEFRGTASVLGNNRTGLLRSGPGHFRLFRAICGGEWSPVNDLSYIYRPPDQ